MTIRIWNAFASNNSGSYVIVGVFRSTELAQEVAEELLVVCREHSQWRELYADAVPPSPLQKLADKYGIASGGEGDQDDAWPEHSGSPHPDVFAVGHQVFVHSDYTVSMPRVFGHVFYVRGGRVSVELDHAHGAIAARFDVWFPWQDRKNIDIPARIQAIVDALNTEGGALSKATRMPHGPAWRPGPGGHPDLEIGACFEDLAVGYTAVEAVCRAMGASVRVNVSEGAHGDPFADLRPCIPPTAADLVDVWIEDAGLAPTNLTKLLALDLHLGYTEARAIIDRAPVCVAHAVPGTRGAELVAKYAVGNAVVTLRKPVR